MGIHARIFIAENSDINITCGVPQNGGERVGIVAGSAILRDNVDLSVANGDLLVKTNEPSNAIKTLQAKKISNLADCADEAAFNAALFDPDCFYDSSSNTSSIRIADSSAPASISTYGITQVKTAKTDDILTDSTVIDVDLNECFEGGSGKYSFTASGDLPSWLQLTDDGMVVLSGSIPNDSRSTGIYKFTVTDADADLAGEPLEFDFIVGAVGNVHEVKITSDDHGTVSPEPGSYYYTDGDSVTITAQPADGYRTTAFLDGKEVDMTSGFYTISSISEAHTFDVRFRVETEFDVTVNCGEYGSVTDWDKVAEYILSRPEHSTIEISMNGLTSVPAKVIQALRTMKDTGEFVIDSTRACIVYCDSDYAAGDMNLEMMYSSVSAEGLRGTVGIKLDISGSSVPYTMRVNFRKEFAGKIANMYRMTSSGAEFAGDSVIGGDGDVLLDNAYTKGVYIVMIDSLSDLPGDADNNAVFNALDAAAVLKHSTAVMDAANPAMADFNHDGSVDALDAAAMLRMLVG